MRAAARRELPPEVDRLVWRLAVRFRSWADAYCAASAEFFRESRGRGEDQSAK